MQKFSPRNEGYNPPHQAAQPRVPRMTGFEDQWGILLGESKGSRKQTLLLEGAHKISHVLRPREEAVI